MTTGTLVRRALAERRRLIVPLVVLAAVNLGVYAGIVYPLSLRVASSESRADAARARLRNAEAEARGITTTLSRTEQSGQDLERFYEEVLPADLSGARRLTYARLDELAREHGLLAERRTYVLDDAYDGRLRKLEIAMSLAGEYEDIRGFIHALETGEAFVVIEHVSLAEGASPDGPLALRLRLATYFPERANEG